MDVHLDDRQPGEVPWGALAMATLTALPLGAWLVARGWLDFGTCGLKELAGLPCMMCGATRATLELLRGDLLGALAFQPMTIVTYVFIVLWGLGSLAALASDRAVRWTFSERDLDVIKVAVVVLPLANWAYLIGAGI